MASGRKRSSPWGEISPLQFKMHVGMKEGATDFEKLVGCCEFLVGVTVLLNISRPNHSCFQ